MSLQIDKQLLLVSLLTVYHPLQQIAITSSLNLFRSVLCFPPVKLICIMLLNLGLSLLSQTFVWLHVHRPLANPLLKLSHVPHN